MKEEKEFKVVSFKFFNKAEWNQYISTFVGSRQTASWQRIDYQTSVYKTLNLSFAVRDAENKIVCFVPLAIHNGNERTFSFGGPPCSYPLFSSKLTQSKRKKILIFLKEIIENLAIEYKVKFYLVERHPVIYTDQNFPIISSENQFELNFWQGELIVHNTLIMDLNKSQDEMNHSLSKYRKKDINKSIKKNITISIFDYKKKINEINEIFIKYKNHHLISAGRLTRPDNSWNIMKEQLLNNEAILFVSYLKDIEISFLFCGIYEKFSWGWSQVNVEIYEREYSPRHLLEWEAIKYFKENQFKFYDIGERFYPSKNFNPTIKQMTISDFKEKYGAKLYPKAWYKFNFY
jgi:hypothetical protein